MTPPKMIRRIEPFDLRVLVRVRVLEEPDVAESGLYLPAGAKEEMREARILETKELLGTVDEISEGRVI